MSSSLEKNEDLSFGSYELVEKVATGGMAEVYKARARRPGGISKVVCLKRIHPSLCADSSFVDMFVEEARLGLNLSHGNIVPVFDFGCIDGYHYLVMEYIEGYDLAEVIARTRIVTTAIPSELAAFIVIEVLEGLSYAHGRKDENQRPLELVHRDISPSNVMISSSGEVKILDFGIARSALREFHTRTGIVKGKPGYMAPEQALGEAVDARADIYACGVMLAELITGERPSKDPGTLGSSHPSDAIEEDLASIVERAVEGDLDERYSSAADMRNALHEFLDQRGARPHPAALSEFVDSLFEAPASVPDWSHQEDAFERHLAAIVDEREEEQNSIAIATTEVDQRKDSTEPLLTPVESNESRSSTETRKSRPLWVLAAIAATVVALLGGYYLSTIPDAPLNRDAEEPSVEQRIPTPPEPAKIEIRTDPPGASIVIDEELSHETTPVVLDIDEGSHRIELRLEGYAPFSRTIEAGAGQQVLLDTVLATAPGSISATSEPTGAEVRFDGRSRGETPTKIEGLDRRQAHSLEISRPGYADWRQEVSFGDEVDLVVHAELQREARHTKNGTGSLSVVATPWAEVILDGKSIGVTPIIRRSVKSGRHVLILRNPPRRAEERRVVNVPINGETRVSVDLTQQ